MQYYICFLLIYFTYIIYIIILHYIYALNNLYVSIPIFWAGLQHHVQEQLPVCKKLYIRRQQVIKLLPTVAETVLSSHKFWLIQSTLNKKKESLFYEKLQQFEVPVCDTVWHPKTSRKVERR